MGPNDAQIVRIFSREERVLIADFTMKATGNAEIVVEAEAGHTRILPPLPQQLRQYPVPAARSRSPPHHR
ncbi:hypothetical protein ABT215_14785 [Streptomyces sp900105755]|uniref:hypothetical protein n=1 Tax=Streptomyces sp. 900105755 TaxID=3154389 RepID=UPI00331B0723